MSFPHTIEIGLPLFRFIPFLGGNQNPDLISLNYPYLTKKSQSMKHQYKRIVVPRFEVDGKKTEGEIAL